MKRSFGNLISLAILALTAFTVSSQTSFHLEHPTHHQIQRRHQLGVDNHKFVIYHNMRLFNFHQQSHLQHDSTAQNYGLNDMGYFFSLNLTIANIPYRLNIDTGSSDIFIKGQSSPGVPQNKYKCQQCYENNQRISIGYLDGFLDTYQANLPVQLGQHKFNESILVAYTAPHNFEQAEGLVGLSFPQLARNRDPTFVQTLIDNKIIGSYSFGVNLNFQEHKRSFISFGSPDIDLFEGELTKYPISTGYFYKIKIKGLSVGDGPKLRISTALFDTGNTCISIPVKYENYVLVQFNSGNNSCAFDRQEFAPQFSLLRCKVRNYDQLPSLKIYVGAKEYEINKDVYFQRCVKDQDGDLCDTYIESVKGQSQLFLGDGFFNRYYTYFDLQNRQIGIAKNKEVLSYKNMFKDMDILEDEDRKFFRNLGK